MKIILCGHARHGKDSVAGILASKYGLTFEDSSMFACREFIFPALREKHNYETLEECYADRVHHRKLWYDMIAEYNAEDPARLAKQVFAKHDVYCGMRRLIEVEECRKVIPHLAVLWVDADERMPPEIGSNTIHWHDADYVINNNGPLSALEAEVFAAMQWIS